MSDVAHTPVLVAEVLAQFAPHSGDRLLDATVGHGGHAEAYLKATAPDGSVLGLDADAAALATAEVRLAPFAQRVTLRQANFAELVDSVRELTTDVSDNRPFQHILFDLGIGSHQLADATRGFSFAGERSLSMRYGVATTLPPAQLSSLNYLEQRLGHLPDAGDILQHLSEAELAELIWVYGEERFRGRIARALRQAPLPATSQELAERITDAVPSFYRHGRLHPATRTFQALRLAVNRELEALTVALPQALTLLAPGGVLAVISFHSLEDRIVKNTFRYFKIKQDAKILTKKPIGASDTERAANPRSRSAKLRALKRAT